MKIYMVSILHRATINYTARAAIIRNSSGDEIANVNFFYGDIFNHFYAARPESYRIL